MRIQHHHSDLGRWQMAQRPAHPRLRPFFHGFVASTSYLPHLVHERLLPLAEVPLLLNFGAPHRRQATDGSGSWTEQRTAWIVGLHEKPQLHEAVGEREFMVVRFTPFGAHDFLRARMHELQGQVVPLDAIDPKLESLIMSRVGAHRSWAGRFDAMEALIADRIGEAAAPSPSLAIAWRRLEASEGRVALSRVIAEIDYSHRILIAQFKTHIGMTPKVIGRLLRFNRAIRALARTGSRPLGKPYLELRTVPRAEGASVRWADLAADCGYFDQSHLINEFKHFAGMTPADFLRRMAQVD